MVEVILKIEFIVAEALCYEILPYFVPVLYFLMLRWIYKVRSCTGSEISEEL